MKKIVQVGMCPIFNWPKDYNWGETDKHKTFGGHWEKYSGVGGVGDEIAMRMFFQPYTQYKAIKTKYPDFYFKHYSSVHPREYDPNPLFNGGSVLSLYENNPYIDEIVPIDNEEIYNTDFYRAGSSNCKNEQDGLQWFLRSLDNYLLEIRSKYKEIALEDILQAEDIELNEEPPCLYLGEKNERFAHEALAGLKRPLIGIQVNKSANNIIELLPGLCEDIQKILPNSTVVLVGTTEVPRRWIGKNVVPFSGKTNLLQCISIIDNLDLFLCMFSGLMYSAFIRKTPTIVWAEEEKGSTQLGHIDWYSKNLKLDPEKNKFIVKDSLSVTDVLQHVSDISALLCL